MNANELTVNVTAHTRDLQWATEELKRLIELRPDFADEFCEHFTGMGGALDCKTRVEGNTTELVMRPSEAFLDFLATEAARYA